MWSVGNRPGLPVKSGGFTLLELLVVLALAAVMLAITPPLLSGMLPGVELKGAARELVSALRYTRSKAITARKDKQLLLNLENKTFSVSDRSKIYHLPEKANIEMVTADTEVLGERLAAIRFFPDGSSTGGRITLAYDDRRYQVDVDWFTGRVSIVD